MESRSLTETEVLHADRLRHDVVPAGVFPGNQRMLFRIMFRGVSSGASSAPVETVPRDRPFRGGAGTAADRPGRRRVDVAVARGTLCPAQDDHGDALFPVRVSAVTCACRPVRGRVRPASAKHDGGISGRSAGCRLDRVGRRILDARGLYRRLALQVHPTAWHKWNNRGETMTSSERLEGLLTSYPILVAIEMGFCLAIFLVLFHPRRQAFYKGLIISATYASFSATVPMVYILHNERTEYSSDFHFAATLALIMTGISPQVILSVILCIVISIRHGRSNDRSYAIEALLAVVNAGLGGAWTWFWMAAFQAAH